MSETLLLIKTFLLNSLSSRKKKKGLGNILIVILPFLLMIYLSVFYSYTLYSSLPINLYYLGLYAMMGSAFTIIFIMGITYSQGMLFGFKDYDLLMSFPIKKDSIIFSKFASYFSLMLTYALLYGIPSLIIYGYFTKQGFLYYLISIISFLFFPLIPMVLSSLIGYFIKRLSEGKKYSNLINNALSVIVIVAIMTISFTSGNTQMSDALIRLEEYVSYIPSLKLFVEGIRYQNLLQLSFFIVISIIVFIVFIKVFSMKILMVSALGNQGYHEKNFKLRKTDSQAPMFALMKREAKRYFSNFNYVMNTAMGIIFVWIFVFYLLLNPTVFQSLSIRQYESDFIPPALLGCAFFFCISSTTSTSISLEGKTLWILKSFPLKVEEIFTSKVLFNVLLLIVPIIPALCIIAFLLNISLVGLLLSILYVCSIALFVGFFGLVMNLKFPKLEFDREIEVIKQSLSVFLMIMFGILVALLVFGLYFFLTLSFHLDGYHAFSCIIVLLFMLDGILLFLLKNWGVNRFLEL